MKKILVIQQKMIGDVLTSSVLFEELRHAHPNAQLDYLINSHTFPVVENNPFIDDFIFFTKDAEQSKKELFKLAKQVRKRNYDVVIDVYSKLSSNLISLLSGAKTKISYYKPYTSFVYNKNIKRKTQTDSKAGLAIVNRFQLLEPLNIFKTSAKPKIYLSEKEIDGGKQFLTKNNIDLSKPLFMISVLGSDMTKTYPFGYMANVIDTIAEVTKGQILFNYIPNQKDDAQTIFNMCKKSTQNHILFDVFGRSLREFLTITHYCTALIGNEGGAVNMAKALDIPTFTIFSPWIDTKTWSVFEDTNNVSVHLNNYKPNLFKNKTAKELKKEISILYQEFKPNYFTDQLAGFLKKNNSI